MEQNPPRIAGFDALRALSVLLVVFSHAGILQASSNRVWVKVFSVFNTNFGVRTFFVLSGFLITTNLIEEWKATARVDIRTFMIKRAARILPLYFLVVIIALMLVAAGLAFGRVQPFLFATFYAYNFIPQHLDINYLSHLWSLAVEEQFYLIWPFVFFSLIRWPRMLMLFCAIIIFLCWFRVATGFSHFSVTAFYPDRWTIPAIHPIMSGAIAAIGVYTSRSARSMLKSSGVLPVAAALICLPLYAPASATTDIYIGFGLSAVTAWIFLNQERPAVQSLDWGPIGYVGAISYGLYMWQGFLTGNGPYRDVFSWPPPVYIGTAMTFIIAPISYKYFEQPVRKRVRDSLFN